MRAFPPLAPSWASTTSISISGSVSLADLVAVAMPLSLRTRAWTPQTGRACVSQLLRGPYPGCAIVSLNSPSQAPSRTRGPDVMGELSLLQVCWPSLSSGQRAAFTSPTLRPLGRQKAYLPFFPVMGPGRGTSWDRTRRILLIAPFMRLWRASRYCSRDGRC